MKLYLACATSTIPDVAGLDIELAPVIYAGRRTQLYPHPYHDFIRWLEADNVTAVFDPQSCDAVADHILSFGKTYAVIDWEMDYTRHNKAVYLRILRRLRSRGLSVWRYGCDPRSGREDDDLTLAADGPLMPVWYQFSPSYADWVLTSTKPRLAEIRAHKELGGFEIVGWVNDYYGTGPAGEWGQYDGKPLPPKNTPVEAGKLSAQLMWMHLNGVTPCLYVERMTDQGDFAPFPEQSEAWGVVKELAGKN